MNLVFPVLCLVVCLCRIVDVALATTRTVLTVKGKSYVATIIGFTEALLWFLVIREALNFEAKGIETYIIAISYALGFAIGTFTGGMITSKLIKTKINIQIITSTKNDELITTLNEAGYGVTILIATGATKKEERYMLLIETDNKHVKLLKKIINEQDPKAFVTISDIKSTQNGYFRQRV